MRDRESVQVSKIKRSVVNRERRRNTERHGEIQTR